MSTAHPEYDPVTIVHSTTGEAKQVRAIDSHDYFRIGWRKPRVGDDLSTIPQASGKASE